MKGTIVITAESMTIIGRKRSRTQSATENPGTAGESLRVGLIVYNHQIKLIYFIKKINPIFKINIFFASWPGLL